MDDLLNIEFVYFVMKECGPTWRLEKKEIQFYDLVIILDGSADYIINGEKRRFYKNDIVFMPPGSTREATTTGMVCAAFDFVLKKEYRNFAVPETLSQTGEFMHWLREFNSEWLQKNDGYEMKCGALFLLMLHNFIYDHDKSVPNLHVEKIKRHIVDHFTEPLSVASLAEIAGINPVYCGTLFKRIQKCTISEYINRVRINKAAALLEHLEDSISEVAYKTGFNDIYYFSSTFKRLVGVSPSVYKKQMDQSIYIENSFEENYFFLQD